MGALQRWRRRGGLINSSQSRHAALRCPRAGLDWTGRGLTAVGGWVGAEEWGEGRPVERRDGSRPRSERVVVVATGGTAGRSAS